MILDVDGTLVDTNYQHVEAWARALHEVGLTVPRAAIHRQVGKGADQFLPTFVQDPALARRADEVHARVYAELRAHGYALPGARELLAALAGQGYRVYLASSAKPEELEDSLETLAARDHVAGIVSSSDVARSKPAPDVFRRALEVARVAADQAVVLGDTLWDVLAARAAGLRVVCVLTGGGYTAEELRQAGAAAVHDDCAALLASGFPRGF
ncbi:MAG TPA: HAD family hydrolase [Polyangia bacterium]|nr:HAD family hydrolase [Polyangia bacterium]